MIIRILALGITVMATTDFTVSTKDALTILLGSYSSILFTASSRMRTDAPVPIVIRFETSGDVPPGMIFEPYPCHKPNMQNCPSIARADGVYLDGFPTERGSFKVKITATDGQRHQVAKRFTVVVNQKN